MVGRTQTENRVGETELLASRRPFAGSGFGIWARLRAIFAVMGASVLLPIEASDASWLSDVFSSRQNKSAKHVASQKRAVPSKPAALIKSHAVKPDAPKPIAIICDPQKFRIILDVGHTAASEGATSARNVAEFAFNLHLARRIEEKLKAEGFAATKLLVTEGKARSSLIKRVNATNNLPADFFLSIHHDSVPNKFLENWEFDGKKGKFCDRFGGYSVFVSHDNPDFKTSLSFAELLAGQMKATGLEYAHQYNQAIMGRYQHPILNKETGVYSYDHLVVLSTTRMPAVLLEAGSIINRDEELKMDSAERRDLIAGNVASAMKQFCEARRAVAASPRLQRN